MDPIAACVVAVIALVGYLEWCVEDAHRKHRETEAQLSKTLKLAWELSAQFSRLLSIKRCTVCGAHVHPTAIDDLPRFDVTEGLIDELRETE